MTQLLPPKKEVALALLERSNVDVYLDPRAKGVVVPPQFRKEPRLILKIGLNMPVPIPDLRLDDDSMSCTLSFNRSPFYCVVPWTSVFAMVGEDGRGMVWPDDVPQELAVKVVEPGTEAGASPSPSPAETAGAAPTAVRRGETSRRASARDRAAQARADEAASPSPSRGGAAGKAGKKKKKEEGPPRPVLVAVPSAPSAPTVPPSAAGSAGSAGASAPPVATGARAEGERRNESPASERPREIRQPPESRRPAPPNAARPRDGVSPVPSRPRPGPGGPPSPGGPKRELPPYLRVVK